jgi:TolA-binding protein
MTTVQGRRVKVGIGELRTRLEGKRETDQQLEKAIADLTRALDDSVQALAASPAGGANLEAARVATQIAALQGRADSVADEFQRQAQARTAARSRLEKRVLALEQVEAQLADKVGLSIPSDKEELWRGAIALLSSGRRSEGRRYCQAFIDRFPQDSRASQAYLALGRSYADDALYSQAATTYQQLLSRFPTAPEVPTAMWQLSRSFVELSFCSDARTLLRDLVARYPKSPEAVDAAKQLRTMKRDSAGAECVS